MFWEVYPPQVHWTVFPFLWTIRAFNGHVSGCLWTLAVYRLPELGKEEYLLDQIELGVDVAVALGVGLHSGGFDADDDAAVAEALDADPFGAREEFEDVDCDGDEERVSRTFHSLEREFRIRCRLSRC